MKSSSIASKFPIPIFIPIRWILHTIKQINTRTMSVVVIATIITDIMIDVRLACDATVKMWLCYCIFSGFARVLFFVLLLQLFLKEFYLCFVEISFDLPLLLFLFI